MSNLKFHIDKPDPKDEQINKHKDFKKLMYNYQSATKPLYQTPLYKNKKVFRFRPGFFGLPLMKLICIFENTMLTGS